MNTHDLVKTVRALLLAEWDPIGIRDEPKAGDEYDSHAPAIAALLRDGVDANHIAAHLLRIEVDEMCLSPNPIRAKRVALKFLSLVA
jgi:hypothetical protein